MKQKNISQRVKEVGLYQVKLPYFWEPLAGYWTQLGSGAFSMHKKLAEECEARLTEIGKTVEDCWTGTHYADPVDENRTEINGWSIRLLIRLQKRRSIFG